MLEPVSAAEPALVSKLVLEQEEGLGRTRLEEELGTRLVH